jgi:formylmethanofuran dehydrogenase subunit B
MQSHPRFIERFVTPTLADGRPRHTIAVGPQGVMPDASTHRHLPLARDVGVEAARWLQMRLSGRHSAPTDAPQSATCLAVAEAIQAADCVAIVTGDADDPVGLEAWSIVHLIRTIAHEKPAFQIPLGAGLKGGGADVAGAATVCTWRYAAAGAITRADRMGSRFLPGEADARRLIERGEVDAVVILDRASDPLEQAVAARGDCLSVVRICGAAEPARRPAGRWIQFRCASDMLTGTGTMLREDGRRVVLVPHQAATLPHMHDLLVDLTAAVLQSPTAGGRP